MAMFSHLCMNCMNPLPEGVADGTVCPTCNATVGEPNPPQFLQTGTVLSERYMVGYLQQAGGDAAVYAGYDTVLKSPIVIREFWPQTLCEREADDTLRVVAGCEQPYKDYLAKFLAHARVVARMRDLPASIPIYDIFQQNNTAYTVSERCEGETLAAYLEKRGGRLSWDEVRPLFIPMMASLISLHKAGVRHFGLTPEALVLGEDGKLHIGDFAIPEARTSDSELSADLRSGYAAPEQYSFGATCTEAVDVYGLAAVIFRTLVGNPPPDGQTRPKTNSDLTVPADVAEELPPHVAAALFSALQPSVEKRMASIAELRDRLSEAPAVAALLDDEADTAPVDEEEEEYEDEPRSHRTLFAVLIAIGVIAAMVVLAAVLLKHMFPGRFGSGGNEPIEPDVLPSGSISISDTTSAHQANMKVPVPYLLGQKYTDLRGKFVEDRAVLLGGLQYSENIAPGIVISQNPKADEEVDITKPVYVIISAGPEYVTIPDLTGWPLDHAIAYMQALGFEVQIDDVSTSSQEAGHIDSTSPARGNSLARGAMVRLRVSTATTTEETTTTTEAPATTTQAPTTQPTTTPPTSRPTNPPTSRPTTTEPAAPTTEPTTEPTGEPTEEEQTTTGGEGDTTTTALPADV